MDQETINIVIGAQSLTIIVLIIAMYAQSRGLQASFPPAITGILEVVTAALKDKAASTPSLLDDKAVEVLEGAQGVLSRPRISVHPLSTGQVTTNTTNTTPPEIAG